MRERLRGSKKVIRMIREIRTLKAEGKDVSQKKRRNVEIGKKHRWVESKKSPPDFSCEIISDPCKRSSHESVGAKARLWTQEKTGIEEGETERRKDPFKIKIWPWKHLPAYLASYFRDHLQVVIRSEWSICSQDPVTYIALETRLAPTKSSRRVSLFSRFLQCGVFICPKGLLCWQRHFLKWSNNGL